MAEIKFEGIAKLNKGLKKRMDMSAVKDTECSSRYWNTEKKYRY